jgi:hypothetical protein
MPCREKSGGDLYFINVSTSRRSAAFVTIRYINSAYDSLSYLHTQKYRFAVALDVTAKELGAENKERSSNLC